MTPIRRQKIGDWEDSVHDKGASVGDVVKLEKILKRPIIIQDIAHENIYNSGKYTTRRHRRIELICHNGHAWSKDLSFPQSREVFIYDKKNVWDAITEATKGEAKAVWLLGGGGG